MKSFKQFLESLEDEPGKWEDNDPESIASINMIKDLESVPKVQSWRGNPTWDFGNGVLLSLTNMARNVDTDSLHGSWFRPKSQPPSMWYVENISSSDKGKGYASQAMEKLLAMADKNGITLRLWPHRSEKGKKLPNDKQLAKWYQKYGFNLISGTSLYYERKPNSVS